MKISLEQAAELLKKHDSFILTAHVNPDGDAIGSLLALALTLKAMQKQVFCLLDDEIPNNFKFLSGLDMIARPDEAAGLPTAELLVILDSSDRQRTGAVGELCKAPVLNIDHHISNEGFADYCCLDSQAAATGEMIAELLKLLAVQPSLEIAEALYTAIATDCGFFRYSNTTPRTMNIAAELLSCGVKPHIISEQLEQKPLSSVKTMGRAIDNISFFADGKIGCMLLNNEFLADCESTEGFIDIVRNIENLDLAVLIKEVEPNVCRVSMRARTIDVSLIAVKFGGGGHKKAAGCTIKAPLAEVGRDIIAAAVQQLEA